MTFYILRILVVIGMITGISACENLPETKSGVAMKFMRTGNGINPNHGEIISLNMSYTSEDGKVLFDTKSVGAPVQIMFDTAQWKYGGMLYEVLELLEVGDSVHFDIPAENLFEVSFQQEMPDSIDRDTDITFYLGLAQSVPEEALRGERELRRAKVEATILENYLSERGIDAAKTENGLRYVIHQEGSGPLPKTGEILSVGYEVSLLDGVVFESIPASRPYSFHLGYGRVIPGWDEAFPFLKEGSKATLYVPSALAYGEVGAGQDIPPNSILIFEVELFEIKPPGNN